MTKRKKVLKTVLMHLGLFAGLGLFLYLFGRLFGSFCPVKRFLGFSCPFCGMTRAHLAALRLDLSGALSHHPLFFLGLPYLFLLFHERIFSKKYHKIWLFLVVFLTILFLAVFLFRHIF